MFDYTHGLPMAIRKEYQNEAELQKQMLKIWIPLGLHNYDCGMNTLCAIAIISKELAIEQSRYYPSGIPYYGLIDFLNRTNHQQMFEYREMTHIDEFKQYMDEWTITIGWMELPLQGSGHIVLVIRSPDGIYIFDSQNTHLSQPFPNAIEFNRWREVNKFYIIVSYSDPEILPDAYNMDRTHKKHIDVGQKKKRIRRRIKIGSRSRNRSRRR